MREDLIERNLDIYDKSFSGRTYSEISKVYNISINRVGQIVNLVKEKIKTIENNTGRMYSGKGTFNF